MMAASLPLVISPLRKVVKRDGVEVVLVSVEAWADEVLVRTRGLPSELTVALAQDFHEDLERWHQQGADSGALPQQPADRIFALDVSITDDVGAVYSASRSGRGGSGRMFRAEWTFVPGPPTEARSLVVRIEGSETAIDLERRS